MKKLYFKTKFSTVALILVLAISAILVVLPTATAQSTCATYAFIGATPNPVGIHQTTLLHVGITTQLGNVREGWEDLSVTITKPDGTTEKISNIRTDATGGTGIQYTPTMSGEYTLQTHFPEQVRETDLSLWGGIGLIPAGTVMLASDSEILTLVVQDTPVEYYPGFQLPTFYWTRPINAQIREWATFGGSWAGFSMESNRFITSNDDAPEAAHILWTKEIAMGGLVGGEVQGMGGPVAYENGAAYEQKFGAPAILGGILFYNRFEERGGTDVEQDVVAVDLHTGEELWVRNWNNTRLDLAQNFYWQSYNYMGTFAYLWEVSGGRGVPVTWRAFDAFTGRWIYTMTNVPLTLGSYAGGFGSNSWFGSRNEMYAYEVDLNNGWMALWNSSRVVSDMGSWRPHGNTYDCSWDAPRHGGWEWNITIPTGLPGSVRGIELDERVVGANANTTEVTVWGFSLKPGQEGNMLFKNTWDAPAEWSKNQSISWSATSLVDNVGIVHSKETMNYWGFSLTTGKYLWGPTEPEQYLQYLGISTGVAYGRFYSTYMGGILYCYNITTGELLWKYEVLDPYNEILWSPNWPVRIQFITDGKIYLCEMEHSPNQPLPRGGPYLCLNATTGEKIWSISLMYYYRTNTLIGDNIIAMMNSYDQQIYAIGKGPSATTVTASPKVSVYGSSVVVEGMVTDISPGTQQYARTARFPNGVPAVSDDSMSAWMEYVYMQFDRPDDVEDDVEGVKVFLKIQDPNGDYYSTYVTTDINGRFSHMWAPAIAGEYKVTAMFEGSKSYYPSQDTTTFGVDPALDAEDVPSAAEIADTTVNRLPAYPAIPEIPAYLTMDLIILILAAIGVVIGLIAYMTLRKQK
jgi:outer membrane protein assembly factor BamB